MRASALLAFSLIQVKGRPHAIASDHRRTKNENGHETKHERNSINELAELHCISTRAGRVHAD
jgi:hypothetical protein